MPQPSKTKVRPGRRPNRRPDDGPPPPDVLASAIERRTGRSKREAHELADQLLAIFGDESVIEDEELEKEVRSFLYSMHAEGIVRTYTVEGKNDEGRDWLFFHWELDADRIREVADAPNEKGPDAHRESRHPAAPPAIS